MDEVNGADIAPTTPKWRRYAAMVVLALTAGAALYQFQRSQSQDTELVVRLGNIEVVGQLNTNGTRVPTLTREQLVALTVRLVDSKGDTTLRAAFDFSVTGAPIQVSTGQITLPPDVYTAVVSGTFQIPDGNTVTQQWSFGTKVDGEPRIELVP